VSRRLRFAECCERERGTFRPSEEPWLGDHLTALDRFERVACRGARNG
jgi:hypothetical protein